jgi:Domain of unknown function (DUF4352)
MSLSRASLFRICFGKNFGLSLLVMVVLSLASCGGKQSNATAPASPSPAASAEKSQAEPARKVFESGEAVPAGYLGYKIVNSWFKDQGSSSFLYIDIAIVNTDKKERPAAAMKLVDETGKEFSLSDKGQAKEPTIQQVGMVGSGQSKRATAVFEAPKGHEYSLKIPGFSTTDEVQIKLKPAAKPPSR